MVLVSETVVEPDEVGGIYMAGFVILGIVDINQLKGDQEMLPPNEKQVRMIQPGLVKIVVQI